MSQRVIDLRSDTVTLPTEAMYQAMVQAPVGDDVYGDDPTINQLEAAAARLMGKEAGLFVPSGTMGNLIAVMAHTKPGQEVILEENCHIYVYEVAGLARLAGVQAKTLPGVNGMPDLEAIKKAIRSENIHFPETGLICLENTHNVSGGTVLPLEAQRAVYRLAQERGIPLHLDGARIFNAALHLKVAPKEIADQADSVTFCLSKGLSAPVGSVLTGRADFITKARKIRKMLGGGMRQAGVLAAAGLAALETHDQWLQADHDHAQLLAHSLNGLEGVRVAVEQVHSNIVNAFFNEGLATEAIAARLAGEGVLANRTGERVIRFVTHRGIGAADITEAVQKLARILEELGD